MNFWTWLEENYGIDWYTFDDNYDMTSGQGKQYYEMYCEDREEMERQNKGD